MTPPLPDQRCFTCRHGVVTRDDMTCHRYPPSQAGWPLVASNDFCSEWAARAPVPEPVRAHRPADYLRLRLLLAKVLWGDGATEGLFDLQTPEEIAEAVSKRIRTLEQVVAALRAVREVP